MITIYGMAKSRSTRVLWAAEEAGVEYTFHAVNMREGEQRTPAYLAINPNGKVPSLKDGDFTLWESAAIVTYLGEQAPHTGLVPTGPQARALYNQWCAWVISELEQPLWLAAKHTFALPSKLRMPAIKPVAFKEFSRAVKVLALGLGDREFLVGDQFTFADLLATHTLLWARNMYELPFESEAVDAYFDRHRLRPALRNAARRERPSLE